MQVEGVATPQQKEDDNKKNSNTWNSKRIWSEGYVSMWK